MASILWIPVIFGIASYILFTLAVNLPPLPAVNSCRHNVSNDTNSTSQLYFPSSIDELRALAGLLSCYTTTHMDYVLLLFCCAYIYKQSFAIPGSVFLNLLSGSLFGIMAGFPLTCLLTAIGATNCYLLSKFFGKTFVMHYFGTRIEPLSVMVQQNADGLFLFLLSMRLFPMAPNWLMNMAAPLLNIPIHLFFFSVLCGLMPYNFLCVDAGCLLSELTSTSDIFTFETMLKLAATAAAVLVPGILIRKHQRQKQASAS